MDNAELHDFAEKFDRYTKLPAPVATFYPQNNRWLTRRVSVSLAHSLPALIVALFLNPADPISRWLSKKSICNYRRPHYGCPLTWQR